MKFDPALYLVTDQNVRDRHRLLDVVNEAVQGGVTVVQLREKHLPLQDIKEIAEALLKVLRPQNIPLLINDFVEIAIAVGADGVHLGQSDTSPEKARAILGNRAIIGLSIESLSNLKSLQLNHVDYLAASPVFSTSTKENASPPLLLESVREMRSACSLPIVGIGGINVRNAASVIRAGADGIAIVSAIFNTQHPRTMAVQLKKEVLNAKRLPHRALTIAGSDSGGGAGIQADLKTFQALGCYGMSVVTVLTAQNTCGVRSLFPATPDFIADQIDAVLEDIGADAVKLGMLYSASIIEAVASAIKKWRIGKVILDPVMVAKGGSHLLDPTATHSLKKHLLPLSALVTPNIPEAEVLSGQKICTKKDVERVARELQQHCHRILIKGGHGVDKDSSDYFLSPEGNGIWITAPRIDSKNTHGTGCTLSAAIAALVAQGYSYLQAVRNAKDYLQGAIMSANHTTLGSGHGPVDHSWNWKGQSI